MQSERFVEIVPILPPIHPPPVVTVVVILCSCHSTIDTGSVKLAETSGVSNSGSEKVNSIFII